MYHKYLQKEWPSTLFPAAVITLAFTILPTETYGQSAKTGTHQVSDGETLSEIAIRYHSSLAQIRAWNELSGDVIRPGQKLVVVRNETPSPEGKSQSRNAGVRDEVRPYVVEDWDTLGCIAARYGVTTEVLRRLNKGIRPDRLVPGQRLSIPQGHRDSLAFLGSQHIVRPGETLSEIAEDLGVTIDDLSQWNPGIDAEHISPGQVILIREHQRIVHIVELGETISSIAQRYGVTTPDIIRRNRGLDPEHISVGQRLSIHSTRPPTESVGTATCGRLINGRQLPPHPAYVIRDPERSYATEETISHVHTAFEEVMRLHPDAHRVRVHDLSLPEGGPIDDHRSHQSGRDVDIIYYQRRCAGGVCPLRPVLPRELAFGPQWTLFEHWLQNGMVQLIFVDYGLQEVLYNYARRHGATRGELESWFQYPRGRNAQVGIIRHYRNHFDHAHVRFRCAEGDERCE